MTKKIGLGLLIVSFIAVTLPLFYLPTSIFTFILYSFAVLIIFGIAVGLIFVDQPFKASLVPIILLNLIFTVANSMVGVMIDGKVTELAKKSNSNDFEMVKQATDGLSLVKDTFLSFCWVVGISLIALLILKQIRKLRTGLE